MSQHLYQFCPRCAYALEDRPFEGKLRRTCPACGFIYFPDPKVAVVALVEANARVLLIRRAVNHGRGLWALPGGYMDAGELPDAALRREVLEEAGIEIVVGELLEIFRWSTGMDALLASSWHFTPTHATPLPHRLPTMTLRLSPGSQRQRRHRHWRSTRHNVCWRAGERAFSHHEV